MSLIKKEINLLKKEKKKIMISEEKVVLRIGRFKLKKKLFFSVLISIMVLVMGFSKARSLHDEGFSISIGVIIITLLLCISLLSFAVIRKNPFYYIKQTACVFFALLAIFIIATINSSYTISDLIFVAMIVTTVALLIYDVF
jgi:hypothetical protein